MTDSILQGEDLTTYATFDDVTAEFTPQTLAGLCADDGNLVIAAGNPALVRARKNAHAEVTSNLSPVYGGEQMPAEQPGMVSELLKTAELAYLRFFLYSRKPELAAKIGEKYLEQLWKFAETRMDRVKSAIQEIAPSDNPPPQPPANVGGSTVDKGPKMSGNDGTGGPMNFGDYIYQEGVWSVDLGDDCFRKR